MLNLYTYMLEILGNLGEIFTLSNPGLEAAIVLASSARALCPAGKIKMADDSCCPLSVFLSFVLMTTRALMKEFPVYSCKYIPQKESTSEVNAFRINIKRAMPRDADLKVRCKLKFKFANIYSERGRVAEYK